MSAVISKPFLRNAAAWSLTALGLVMSPARADDDRAAVEPSPLYRDECGSCHLAFAPGLLPAESWRRVMGRLSNHYGVDASSDPARARELLAWLQMHAAGAGRRAAPPPQDRITQGTWFLREHKEIGTGVWQRASVGRPSNCGGCHTRADEGSFRERDVAIPK